MRVVIAEDELLVREGLVRLLPELGFEVAATAADAQTALTKVVAHTPDVLITDIRMPPTHSDEGIRLAHAIVERLPSTAILMLSQYLEPAYALRLLERRPAGTGYLLKHRVGDLRMLADAIRRVGAGGSVIDPRVVEGMLRTRRREDPLEALTPREREILGLMAQGLSNGGICQSLVLSPRTVEAHVRSIFAKLHLAPDENESRRVLAVLAYLRTTPSHAPASATASATAPR